MTELLDTDTAVAYIAGRDDLGGLIDVSSATAREIGDGNLNLVFLVKDVSGRGLVIKQTLPYVRSDHSWKVTEDSIFAEARGLKAASEFTPEYAPKFHGLDKDRRLVVVEDLSQWEEWRVRLNQRRSNLGAARDRLRHVVLQHGAVAHPTRGGASHQPGA